MCRKMSAPDRRALLAANHRQLSMRRQCALLGLARSGVYRLQRPANDNDRVIMQRLDALFTAWPFLGSRRMTAMLRAEGLHINRKRVQRLMRRIGIAALGPKPRTTKPAPGHRIFPYLLRSAVIDRPNQVWAADLTDIPIGHGFLYLVAVIDWASRVVLSWRLSNTMDASFCRAALEDARARYGKPEIFNTDQGSQFTGAAFTGALIEAGVRISMDGRGRWMDNVFIERVWRSLKYEAEIRGRRSERLCRRPRGESWRRRILRLRQRAPPSSGARLSHADGRLARRRGADSLWACGQRKAR